MSELSVDGAAARRYAGALFGSGPREALVEVRFRVPWGMGQRFHSLSRLDRLVESILVLSARTDVYVGVLPRRRRSGGRADVIQSGGVVWADCDTSESVAALRAFRPLPAMVVASSEGKRHAYWFLTEPVGVDVIEATNRRMALALGADVVCSDRARILRPAGSVNRKHSVPAAVRLLHLSAAERVSLADLDRVLPPEPASPETVTRLPRRRRLAPGDPLEAIPPPVYVEQLTGLRVGRSGKVPCPFHEDRTPSMHVYDDPERGWYCFGCGRGGSIYDLARCCGTDRRAGGISSSCAASWRRWFDELAGVLVSLRHFGRGCGRALAAESAAQLEVLTLGGSERRFEPSDLGAVLALELGELRGQRAQDVALRRRLLNLRLGQDGWRALLLGSVLLDAGAQWGAV
jgi:CHC2 zinc finger/RepB DNA-primase N-terminal domain